MPSPSPLLIPSNPRRLLDVLAITMEGAYGY